MCIDLDLYLTLKVARNCINRIIELEAYKIARNQLFLKIVDYKKFCNTGTVIKQVVRRQKHAGLFKKHETEALNYSALHWLNRRSQKGGFILFSQLVS